MRTANEQNIADKLASSASTSSTTTSVPQNVSSPSGFILVCASPHLMLIPLTDRTAPLAPRHFQLHKLDNRIRADRLECASPPVLLYPKSMPRSPKPRETDLAEIDDDIAEASTAQADSPTSTSTPIGAIVGATLGGLALLVLLAWLFKRRKDVAEPTMTYDDDSSSVVSDKYQVPRAVTASDEPRSPSRAAVRGWRPKSIGLAASSARWPYEAPAVEASR